MIEIPFRPDFQGPMLAGIKTCTARNKKYGKPGDTFAAFGKTFQIIRHERLPLREIRDRLYLAEGCGSPERFQRVWEEIHPVKGFDPTQKVWVHFFKLIESKARAV